MLTRYFMKLAALIVAPMIALTGCSDDGTDNPMSPQTGAAFVRVAHLSPDAPAVDVMVDGAKVLEEVSFRDFSAYLSLAPGQHRIQVSPSGGDPSTVAAVIDEIVTVSEDTYYTVAATGLLADIGAVVFTDQRETTPTSARIRFIHASPDAPAVDITLTDGTKLFPDVAFNEASGTVVVPAGAYDIQVRVADTDVVALSFADVPLSPGTAYSIFATGRLSAGSLIATVAVDAPGDGSATVDLVRATAEVRVAHLSPDAPNVDVRVDGALVPQLVNVPFQAVSDYLSLEAATRNVQVFVTGTAVDPVIDADVTLLPGEAYTIAATGLVGDGNLGPIVLVDDRSGSGNGLAQVRFVHASPDAPAVDIVVAGGSTLFPGVAFRESAGYAPVGAGTYDLEVRLAQGGALALVLPDVALTGDLNYTVFAVGLAGDGSLTAVIAVDVP